MICGLLECDVKTDRGSTPTAFNFIVSIATTSALTAIASCFSPLAAVIIPAFFTTDIRAKFEEAKCLFYLLGRLFFPLLLGYVSIRTG